MEWELPSRHRCRPLTAPAPPSPPTHCCSGNSLSSHCHAPLSVSSLCTAHSLWGAWRQLQGCETGKCSSPRMAVERLLRKLLFLEQVLQVFVGFGFTVTIFTLSWLFTEAKPASKTICCRLSFWTKYKYSFYSDTL